MANNIGFGNIYDSTWWGVGKDNSIGWGSVYPTSSIKFEFTINTANSGSSLSNQFQLPLSSGSTVNAVVEWGDGNSDTITSYNQAETLHTYDSGGVYGIKIDGIINGWRFVNGGDKLKILNISNWGTFDFSTDFAFWGCSNLTITASDIPTITSTSLQTVFYGCTNINPDITNWNISGVTSLRFTFYNVEAIDRSFANWDINQVGNFEDFLNAATLSTKNYDETLISWAAQTPQSSKSVNFGSSTYTLGGDAEAARLVLTSTYGWTIADGGGI